jgi:uncharacterized integral membrane protein
MKILSIIILIIIAAVFITQNVMVVEVNLLFWRVSISLALLIIINLLIGFLLGWFIKSYMSYKKSKINKPFDKEIQKPQTPDQNIS